MKWPCLLALLLLSGCVHRSSSEAFDTEEGMASFYGEALAGRPTASGEPFDPSAFTAAHRTLPFGTCVLVQNLANGKIAKVRVNDRGPFVEGRIIDVSRAAAQKLQMVDRGVARVRLSRCR